MDFAIASLPLPVRLKPEIPWTDAELLEFCSANEGLRVEREADGAVSIMTPVGFSTMLMNQKIARIFGNWAEEDGRGVTGGPDGGFTLRDGSMLSPDAVWVSLSQVASLSEEQMQKFPKVCPEFVIELRSPSDRRVVVVAKMQQWMDNGVEVAWLVEPQQRTVTIFRQGEPAEVLVDPTSVQGDGPIQGFELVMSRVWG